MCSTAFVVSAVCRSYYFTLAKNYQDFASKAPRPCEHTPATVSRSPHSAGRVDHLAALRLTCCARPHTAAHRQLLLTPYSTWCEVVRSSWRFLCPTRLDAAAAIGTLACHAHCRWQPVDCNTSSCDGGLHSCACCVCMPERSQYNGPIISELHIIIIDRSCHSPRNCVGQGGTLPQLLRSSRGSSNARVGKQLSRGRPAPRA